jgi:uncharacterized protein
MKRLVAAVVFAFSCLSLHAQAQAKPKVRAVTVFVRLTPQNDERQLAEALGVLNRARVEFKREGYEVETTRITTQPLAQLTAGLTEDQALEYLAKLDRLAATQSVSVNIGPAMLHDDDNPATMHLLERALSTLPHLNASVIIADDSGIHWKTIARTTELVQYVAAHSPHAQGTFNFAATAMLKPYGPFFPGSWHDGPGGQFSIGFEGADVVRDVFTRDKGNAEAATADLTAALTIHAKVADAVGNKLEGHSGWTYMGLDPTPAPLGDVSIGAAIEAFTGARFGSSGTLTASRIITAAVKAVPVKQIGYAGLMVPVMEDKLLAQRWAESAYNIDSLLAYSSVCGTGLDTIPLPGDVSADQLNRIYSDVASLAVKWGKPLSARLQPVPGRKPGDRTDFTGAFLFNTTIHPLP